MQPPTDQSVEPKGYSHGTAPTRPKWTFPIDFTPANIATCEAVEAFTLTSPERVNALIDSVRHVAQRNTPGAFVECGVWRGGSAMAMILTLQEFGISDREFYLYDTYAGMSEPEEVDVSASGQAARDTYDARMTPGGVNTWCYSSLEEVRANIASTGYPLERVHFVEGRVEETIPEVAPERVALLRLDTDWYASTKHELEHLYPRLSDNGVLIIDDYGHWQGARKATDEYFADREPPVLLTRIDKTGRLVIKTG